MPHKPHHIWQERLYARLFQQPYPLFVFDDGVLPAASMWFMMREWVQIFREAGLTPGSRVVLALPPGRAFVAALLAGAWERLTLALCPPSMDTSETASFLDASVMIVQTDRDTAVMSCASILPPTPDIRLLLASSGTSSAPRWFALSDENIFSVVDSHLPHLDLMRSGEVLPSHENAAVTDYPAARVLSVLPLHHAFGLMIDFLPAMFAGAELVRDAGNGRNLEQLLETAHQHAITHCSMVPLLVRRLMQDERGREFLCDLRGGVIGGAPVHAELVPLLRQTRLRVGYGQTEASPGITLGAAGVWTANYLGKPLPKPLGCDVRIGSGGILEFRGANACLGVWRRDNAYNGLETLPPERWHSTGDIVRFVQASTDTECEGFVFCGRADDNFKLSNGRFIPAVQWEAALQQAFPQIQHVLISTATGELCAVLLSLNTSDDAASGKWKSRIAEVCGVPADFFAEARIIPQSAWHFTPKGSIDRHKMNVEFAGKL
jgi:acyl-CoA synthetase (AMP-forming)/AMP-acid ligase II